MTRPEVDVVVPTIGASPHLERCLDSLLGQGGVAVRVLLVEQKASEARIPAAVRRIEAPGRGFAAAANAGLASTTQPLVALVNDDVVVADGWLGALAETLLATSDLASLQGTHSLGIAPPSRPPSGAPSPAVLDGIGIAFDRWWQAVQIGHGRPTTELAPAQGSWREVFGVSATAALYRRDALARSTAGGASGPFDETLESYYEDVELACRLRAGGARAGWVPAARAEHAGSASEIASSGAPRRLLVVRNRLIVVARLLGRRFLPALPRILARDVIDGARGGAHGLRNLAGAWAGALRLVPRSLRLGPPLVPVGTIRRLGAENAWRSVRGAA